MCDVNTWESMKTQIPHWDVGGAALCLRQMGGGGTTLEKECQPALDSNKMVQKVTVN